jgi:PKHD-type hydroxylase
MISLLLPRQKAGAEEAAFWDNFLTQEDIDTLLALPQWHQSHDAQVGDGVNGRVDTDTRITTVGWWTPCEKTNHIWQKIIEAIGQVNNRHFGYDLTGCYEPAQLTLYKGNDNAHYDWHIDMGLKNNSVPRKLSMALLLSDPDDFEGGEFQAKLVSDEPITLEQKQGRAWFFPSYALHRVAPVTKGVRRSLVLWIGGPPFK